MLRAGSFFPFFFFLTFQGLFQKILPVADTRDTDPQLEPENHKKNLKNSNFIAITKARFISCPDLTVKYLAGMGWNKHLQKFF